MIQYVKELMRAFQSSNLGLSPVQANPTSIRITVPKPDLDKRRELVRQASELAETARIAIRNARHKGQKAIKHDVDEKVVGKDEAKGEGKKVRHAIARCARGHGGSHCTRRSLM